MTPLNPAKASDNGERLPVETPFYTGPAGVRADDTGGEFAVLAPMPLGVIGSGKVDGEPVRIISVRPSTSEKRMLVVRFERLEAWQ